LQMPRFYPYLVELKRI